MFPSHNSGPWDPWLPVVENSRLFAQRKVHPHQVLHVSVAYPGIFAEMLHPILFYSPHSPLVPAHQFPLAHLWTGGPQTLRRLLPLRCKTASGLGTFRRASSAFYSPLLTLGSGRRLGPASVFFTQMRAAADGAAFPFICLCRESNWGHSDHEFNA